MAFEFLRIRPRCVKCTVVSDVEKTECTRSISGQDSQCKNTASSIHVRSQEMRHEHRRTWPLAALRASCIEHLSMSLQFNFRVSGESNEGRDIPKEAPFFPSIFLDNSTAYPSATRCYWPNEADGKADMRFATMYGFNPTKCYYVSVVEQEDKIHNLDHPRSYSKIRTKAE